jgi:SRSO17 transposase
VLQRFGAFADAFGACFGRTAQRTAASQYLEGLFNDSARKSMQAMHGRLSDPVTYQALQHFVTHSPWDAGRLWTRLRTLLPTRTGLLAIDDTGLPKQGNHSVGVKRQYCGAKGKIANCQVAVSSMLLSDTLTWPVAVDLYLPEEWCADAARRDRVGVPPAVRFREKWRIALSQVRQLMKAGFQFAAVLADADYGSTGAFRRGLEHLGLRYGVGIRGDVRLWTATSRHTQPAQTIGTHIPDDEWQLVTWGAGTKGPLAARFVARRVRPTNSPGARWLLCERSLADDARKYYLLNLDDTATLTELVRLVRSRWPIEQQYRELKDELGFDHFEGRSYRGWTHHAVLSAIAFTFLQLERLHTSEAPRPTLPAVRFWVREIMGLLYVINNRTLMNLMVSFQRNPPLRR